MSTVQVQNVRYVPVRTAQGVYTPPWILALIALF